MKKKEVFFQNENGYQLSAELVFPAVKEPHNFVIFAHCFTCNKNFNAVKRIATALTDSGFAVLSFDFTGLGKSEGDFEDSNFSSNVQDIVAAAKFLENEYHAPSLLLGHSLGGTAVLMAAMQLEAVKAVATVGSPSDPEHVSKLFKINLKEIEEKGIANVEIGGRSFKIKQEFLEDIANQNLVKQLKGLQKSVLIAHSPQDEIVGIENARELYAALHHPKSFISLDGADHMLSSKEDALYLAKVIGSWAERYILIPEENELKSEYETVVRLGNEESKFTSQVKAGKHHFIADEPEDVGGLDMGPSPYQLLSSALGTCTAMTLRMYAERKKWDLQEVFVHINHSKRHADDCSTCEESSSKIDVFERVIELYGDLSEQQKAKMLEIADKCPVHKTLQEDIKIETRLKS